MRIDYGVSLLMLLRADAAACEVFERKILHKINVAVLTGDDFCIQTSNELCAVLCNMDVVQNINMQYLCWDRIVVSTCIEGKIQQILLSLGNFAITNWTRCVLSAEGSVNELLNSTNALQSNKARHKHGI